MDSGSSIHITHQINLLHNIKPHYELVSFANGDTTQSTHIGDFEGYINNNKISLHKVLFIPDFKRNLISIGKLTEQGHKITFQQKGKQPFLTIYNINGKVMVNIKENYNTNTFKLWILKSKIIKISNEHEINYCQIHKNIRDRKDIFLWHRRFGHMDISQLKYKLPYINMNDKCKICAKAKLRNSPFKRAVNKTNSIFEQIHMDIMGPINPSIYGNKYILSLMDDYSRYNWVIFLKDKSETFTKFHNWYKQINNI